MSQAWNTLESFDCDEGRMELRQRGERDFLITIAGRVLMTSQAQISELKVSEWACEAIAKVAAPRVLIGGLGMAYTLRAALDALPAQAHVDIAELHPEIVAWCQGPMASLTDNAIGDPRVQVCPGDVMERVRNAPQAYDAVIWDLYEGPHHAKDRDPLYGNQAISAVHKRLRPKGRFTIWSEQADAAFERRLDKMRLSWWKKLAGKGGRRHVVYGIEAGFPSKKQR